MLNINYKIYYLLAIVIFFSIHCNSYAFDLTKDIVFLVNVDGKWHPFASRIPLLRANKHFANQFNIKKIVQSSDGFFFINTIDGKLLNIDYANQKISDCSFFTQQISDFSLSPSGTLAYSSSIAGSIDAHDIWSYDPNTGKVTQLTRMAKMQHQPSWCDDRQLVFVSSTSEQSHDLWRLDVPTGSLHQLTAGQLYNFEPSCSVANGIVFSSNRSGNYEIWSTDLEGKHFTQLTSSPGLDGQPAWSPDGSQIAFISNRTGYPAVWVMNRDGSNQHQISPEGMICRNPVWGIAEP